MADLKKMTDEQLVDYIRNQDQEAYLEIVLRYQDKLLRYANYLTHDALKAADIVQDSFIKAFINLQGFKAKLKFSAWLYRIVHNEAVNSLIKYKKEIPLAKDMDWASSENLETELINQETQARVKKCLNQMSVIYSEPLSLFFLEEKSYQEISDILRLPTSTVGTRINRAKILMKNLCQTTQG
jgi:RNA polymerase sigma-70 factor (ECF subfamily)